MNRTLAKIWALAAFIALPLRAANEIKVTPFVGAEPIRLGITLPGAQIGSLGQNLNAVPLIAPMAQFSAIPTLPNLPELQISQMAIAPNLGGVESTALHETGIRASLGEQVQAVNKLSESDASGVGSSLEFGKIYAGQRGGGSSVSVPRQSESTELRPNADGVMVMGRADAYDQEATRIVAKYKGKIDFSEATDVMDDAYAEAYARASIMAHESKGGTADEHSAHIPMTLTWTDGVIDKGGKKIAVHTTRVFFHHATNPQSEIEEGLRRVKKGIEDQVRLFAEGGKADNVIGPLDEVVLGFDTRGYKEIKDFIKGEEAKVNAAHGGRFRFVYLDEVAPAPKTIADMRNAVNALIQEHKNDGLLNVIEGVIYSRYTGLLLELKTAEYYFNNGYKILQGGRELFDAKGHYITELDVVVQSPQGVTYLVEAKSARVPLTKQDVMSDKIIYKLDTYKRNKARLEQKDILGGPLNVVFSVDVGVPPAALQEEDLGKSRTREQYIRNQTALMTFLRQKEKDLSKQYGFPVSFLFLYSVPGQDPALAAESAPSSTAQSSGGNGRKHNRG